MTPYYFQVGAKVCKRPSCRAQWCLRLEHWIDGFVESHQECPNKCGYISPITNKREHCKQHDCRLAPGMCCERCGTYWVPNLSVDVARGMLAERMEHSPLPWGAWVEREFKQNALLLDQHAAA